MPYRPILALIVTLSCLLALPAIGADQKAAEQVKQATVPVFSLRGPFRESPVAQDMLFGSSQGQSLMKFLNRVRKASRDEDVKAIVLTLDQPMIGMAQAEEFRQAVETLNERGIRVYAHGASLSTHSLALVANAGRISVVPTGDVWLTGLYGESMYVRGLLDNIGVEPDFLTCGDYKTAAESFTRTAPSDASKEMTNWLVSDLYGSVVRSIAKGRGVKATKVRKWINNGPYSAEQAKELGVIDAVESPADLVAAIKKDLDVDDVRFDKSYGQQKQAEIDFSTPMGIFQFYGQLLSGGKQSKAKRDGIVIIHVDGPIVLGRGEPDPFGGETVAYSEPIRLALSDAEHDPTVKAVVLRINSPGGSATASDVILRAVKAVQASKPVIVSMGNVAGSGGYYVACSGDRVFADAGTITGSIGVVGGKIATKKMWGKLGITWHSVKRGRNAGLMSSQTVFSDRERQKVQAYMDEIYGVFKSHVVEGRGEKLTEDIDSMAGGRVYTGRQALELGLIDEIGSLYDAIKFAANEVGLKSPDVRVLPRPKNFMELLMEDLQPAGDGTSRRIESGPVVSDSPRSLLKLALPYLDGLSPRRVAAVQQCLRQLETLRHDRVIYAMPTWIFGEQGH